MNKSSLLSWWELISGPYLLKDSMFIAFHCVCVCCLPYYKSRILNCTENFWHSRLLILTYFAQLLALEETVTENAEALIGYVMEIP